MTMEISPQRPLNSGNDMSIPADHKPRRTHKLQQNTPVGKDNQRKRILALKQTNKLLRPPINPPNNNMHQTHTILARTSNTISLIKHLNQIPKSPNIHFISRGPTNFRLNKSLNVFDMRSMCPKLILIFRTNTSNARIRLNSQDAAEYLITTRHQDRSHTSHENEPFSLSSLTKDKVFSGSRSMSEINET